MRLLRSARNDEEKYKGACYSLVSWNDKKDGLPIEDFGDDKKQGKGFRRLLFE